MPDDSRRTMEGSGGLLAGIDLGVLGAAMLEAARGAGIGVTVTFIDGGAPRNVYVSEAAARILGWPVRHLLETDPMSVIAPEDLPRMQERLRRRMSGEGGETTSEIHAVGQDGHRTAIEVTASNVKVGEKNAVMAFFFDVSERRAAERERLRYEARFRELIEIAPEPIGILRDGHFVYANQAYVTTLGFTDPKSLYATPIDALLDSKEAALRDAREVSILKRGSRPPPITYHVRKSDGSTTLLEVSSVYFDYEGQPSVLSMGRDITARKQLEMQLVQADRLAALGTLAAGVAHEINNPLAYVILNLEWVVRKLPEAQDPASVASLLTVLEEARQGAQRVSTIVRELRSFSRADDETRRRVDLESIVHAAIKITGHEIRHRAQVTTSFERVRPVWANPGRLEQVVINLLMNAAQAMQETRAERNEIRVTIRPDAEKRAVLEVADNGEGVPAEVLSRIFDPFFTTKPVGVGTGLGLSICHGIVTSLGGQIAAYSEPGRGATFRVALPTTDEPAEEPPPRASSPPGPGSVRRRLRILVVDDEVPIANTMRDLLEPSHDVATATSAWEALSRVRTGTEFDVLFCDLMMPGLSGVDLYDRLRALRPGIERKIVFMTGGAFTPRASEFLASVPNRRIEKPFTLDLIERTAREVAAENEAVR